MSGFVCRNCQTLLRRSRHAQSLPISFARASSTSVHPDIPEASPKGTEPTSTIPPSRKSNSKKAPLSSRWRYNIIPQKATQAPSKVPPSQKHNSNETASSSPSTPTRTGIRRTQKPFKFKPKDRAPDAIDNFLTTPTWSVRSLLPSSPPDPNEISDAQFDHLLRLSALQLPKENPEAARTEMKQTLLNQLHFVRDIQQVDTQGVKPLVVVRNENRYSTKRITIGLEELKEALGKEEFIGRLKRPRRKREVVEKVDEEDWDCLAIAGEVVERGDERYFVVYSGKEKSHQEDDILSSIKIKKRLTHEEKLEVGRK